MDVILMLILPFRTCQVTAKEEGLRISESGKPVGIESAPYVVALVHTASFGFSPPFCTGSIITKEVVLTAAHCIDKLANDGQFLVVAGCDAASELKPTADSPCHVRSPIKYEVHPEYSDRLRILPAQKVGLFDVALIKVASFQFGPSVGKIAVWAKTWEGKSNPDQEYYEMICEAYGWGNIRPKTPSETLRGDSFTVRHGIGACTACLDDGPTTRLICTDSEEDSVCEGDSGGPLVCNGTLAGVAHVVGKCLVKVGFRKIEVHDDDCNTGRGVFTAWMYICPMLDWIHHKLAEIPDKPASCFSPQYTCSYRLVPALLVVHLIAPRRC